MSSAPPSFGALALARLRAGGYRPRAWARFLAESWGMSRATARARPSLAASWRRLATGLIAADALAIGWAARRHGTAAAIRVALPLAALTATQAGDLYVHLGLHRPAGEWADCSRYATLGPAIALTAARGWVGSWLWSNSIAGVTPTEIELAAALALTVATDLADGPLARRGGQASPLGRYLDGEADLAVWLALTWTQERRGDLPGWLAGIFAARAAVPVAVGLVVSFTRAEPVTPQPLWLGRLAGMAHAAASVVGLVAAARGAYRDAAGWRRTRDALAIVAGGTLTLVALAHLKRLTASGGTRR